MTQRHSHGDTENPATSARSSQSGTAIESAPNAPHVREWPDKSASLQPDLQDFATMIHAAGPAGLTMPKVVADALNTQEGRRWLLRFLVALVSTFVIRCGLGVRPLRDFMISVGISRFMAHSPRTLQRFSLALSERIVRWGRATTANLGSKMRETAMLLVLDEHWHGGMHLVAYDALTGYIVLQIHSHSRSAKAWGAALDDALTGLRVRVLQTVGDDARGLSSCSIAGARVFHGADLFHPLYAISRGFGPPIARVVRDAERRVRVQKRIVDRFEAAESQQMTTVTKKFRPRKTKRDALAALEAAGKSLSIATKMQQGYRDLLRAASAAAHPIQIETAMWNTDHSLRAQLRRAGAALRSWAKASGLGARIDKAMSQWTRYTEAASAQVNHLRARAQSAVATLTDPPEVQTFVLEHLIPLAYVTLCRDRSESVNEREKLRSIVNSKLSEWRTKERVWSKLSEPIRVQLLQFSMQIASTFVRSSSGIEGHNGRSALWHHQRSRMDGLELEARQVLINFTVRGADGKTRAERLFRQPHRSLLSSLCKSIRAPGLPRTGVPSPRRVDLRADILAAV